MDRKILFTQLDRVGLARPDHIAIEEGDRRLPYRELVSRSNQVAQALVSVGSRPGEPVGIFMPSSVEYICGIIGISKAGGIFMPLELTHPVRRLEYILDLTRPGIIITTSHHLDDLLDKLAAFGESGAATPRIMLTDYPAETIALYRLEGREMVPLSAAAYPGQCPSVPISGNDSLYLLNTSGSTGNPKMIEGMHKSLSHFIHWEVSEFNLDGSVKICQLARVSFDLSLREIFVPLLAGGTLCIPDAETKNSARRLLRWLSDSGVTLVHIVPSVFRLLLRELRENLEAKGTADTIAYVLLAGEALFGRDVAEWRSLVGPKAELVNMYGPSETTLAKVFYRIRAKAEPQEIIRLGNPLPNTVVIILSDGKLCNAGAIGEIHLKTPFRSKGYYKDPVLTAEKFVQNPLHNDYEDIVYKTGDLGRYLDDGTVAFAGRLDSQVKIRGNRVELSEVEQTVLKYRGIKQVVVLPVKGGDNDQALACYYLVDTPVAEAGLRGHIAQYLPEYMHPSYYVRLEEFPLNLNGKIDKKLLPKPEELLYAQLAYVAPADELEHKLASIWAGLLGLKRVGVTNTFFELGGHSLTVAKMLTSIYKELGIEISLKETFEQATIRRLAGLLRQKRQLGFKSIAVIPTQPHYALSYPQQALWLAEQLEENRLLYNIPFAYLLKGDLRREAFDRAFQTLVDRHESLRTTFGLVDEQPRQFVHAKLPFRSVFVDATGCADPEETIRQHLDAEAHTAFDLAAGPLLRVRLVQLAAGQHLLIFTVHHIIFDGWSKEVLVREFTALYNQYCLDRPAALPPLPLQYKDYATWLNGQLTGDRLAALEAYWLPLFDRPVEPLALPADHPRPAGQSHRGTTLTFPFDESLTEAIGHLSRRNGCTPFAVCLSATVLLLHKYTGRRDLVVGTPLAGRDHKDLENQIGMFVNMMPLRLAIDPAGSYRQLLEDVKNGLVEAYEHQSYPYLMLLDKLQFNHQQGNLPLLEVLVQSADMGAGPAGNGLANLQVQPYANGNITSKAELTFDFHLSSCAMTIEYNTGLFTAATIGQLCQHLVDLLQALTGDDGQQVGALKLTRSAGERHEEEAFRKLMAGL
jgi:amino acid adenylation domain-containing protein